MQDAKACRDCGAPLQDDAGLCKACRERRIREAFARLDRQRRLGKWAMASGALWLALLFIGVRAGWWAASPGLFAVAGVGGLLFFGGGFAWLVAWGVAAFHRDKGSV